MIKDKKSVWIAIPTDGKRNTLALALHSLTYHINEFSGLYIWNNGAFNMFSNPDIIIQINYLKSLGIKVIVDFEKLPCKGFTQLRHELLLRLKSLKAKYALLLDDDATLHNDCLRLLKETVTSKKFGWSSPVILYPESYSSNFKRKISKEWEKILCPFCENEEILLKNKVIFGTTTCLLVNVKNSLKIGGFDFASELPDFAEDRFFTAKFFKKFDVFVHKKAVCHVVSDMKQEGKRWKIPTNKLLLQPNLLSQLDKEVISLIINK